MLIIIGSGRALDFLRSIIIFYVFFAFNSKKFVLQQVANFVH